MLTKYLKSGYFIVYKTRNTFYNKLISKFQRKNLFNKKDADYIHVETLIGNEWSVNAKFPRIRISNIFKLHKNEYVKIVKPKIDNYNSYRKDVAIECLTRVNLMYGIIGLLWFPLQNIVKRNYFAFFGDFCSELCGYGLWMIFVIKKNLKYSNILPKRFDILYPADFLNPKFFEVVWEGKIEELKK